MSVGVFNLKRPSALVIVTSDIIIHWVQLCVLEIWSRVKKKVVCNNNRPMHWISVHVKIESLTINRSWVSQL